ncbi:MAG: hypothetical protein Q9220_001270 [cf. Caloplaca sp. 1 TL-2023]
MAGFQLACGIVIAILSVLGNAVAVRGIQTGVNPRTGERPFRQEFSIFRNSGPAFDLYILSLQKFQQCNQTILLSYFEIAGWQTGSVSNLVVAHSRQQVIWSNAQQIAATYPRSQRTRYRDAARTLRVPYWDWSTTPMMPAEVSQPFIQINAPNGNTEVINPLYNYTFHPLPSSSDFPPQIRESAYQLLTQQPNYGPFSNTAYSDGRGARYNSIENLHNGVHMFVGNGGHMSVIPYSSFDPIFWLHHA